MRRVFRYEVPVDDKWHKISLTSAPVHVAGDVNMVEFWAESLDNILATDKYFIVVGTGHPVPQGGRYVGTCPRLPNGIVWHLFGADTGGLR